MPEPIPLRSMPLLTDIPGQLRHTADRLEANPNPDRVTLVISCSGGELEVHSFGAPKSKIHDIGILSASAALMATMLPQEPR